ncbi:hypothetical protein BGZ50_002657 [Haplosporangium sp. Z 11]|nr:hypothetical protein BGZ50_002657 [Haplosporangium sp. Z 11]
MYWFQLVSLLGMLIIIAFWLGDYNMLWHTSMEVKGYYWVGLRDYYFWGLSISPAILSHFVTMWGHYYRADFIFQSSVRHVSWPASLSAAARTAKRMNQTSFWEKKDRWLGYTVKYWVLIFISIVVNLMWFIQPIAYNIKKALNDPDEAPGPVWAAYIGFGSGYAAMGACGMVLFLVLRRSMLHALGFTYAELLPLHRLLGQAVIYWSIIHTAGYMAHFIIEGEVLAEINFDGETRGPQNIVGFVALAAMIVLGAFSYPTIRRRFYVYFLGIHRYMTIIAFAGTLMHYPYFITWYYVIPSMCLYMADRFMPMVIQAFSVAPDVICSFNKESDILTIVIVSKNRLEPLKPYYPGDYINLYMRSLDPTYHPFTIASYWPEDPYSMTLYIRTFGENTSSWTHALSELCDPEGKPVMLNMEVEGVFGDRRHDYLCSDEIVIFAAGAALTTFMPLIKSIAAQIEAVSKSSEPQKTIKVYLIATFRYESELYSYGDFLHQITNDPRFTSWLTVDIRVSRPSKTPRLASVAIEMPESRDQKTMPTGSTSSETDIDSRSISSIEPTDLGKHEMISEKSHAKTKSYAEKPLPTFPAADSNVVSTIHAKRDLFLTACILLIPFGAFIGLRYAGIEGVWNGESRWCRTTKIYDQNMTNKCMWNYTMTPGVLHMVAGAILGYGALFYARWSTLRSSRRSVSGDNVEDQSAYMRTVLANNMMAFDDSIRFKSVRLDVAQSIQELIAAGVGMSERDENNKSSKTTSVFVGGPDRFLDSVEKQSKVAKWSVEFHRETWSP